MCSSDLLFDAAEDDPSRRRLVLHGWVGKEAALKALGTGVHGVPAKVEVLPQPEQPRYGDQMFRGWWPPMPSPYVTCVATAPAIATCRLVTALP